MSNLRNLGLAGCFAYLLGVLIVLVPLSFWTDRNLDFWLSQLKGETVDCPFWLSFIVSCFAPATFILNIIGEVARLAV
jgi:hypothetical protein